MALGRGLSALIPEKSTEAGVAAQAEAGGGEQTVDIKRIKDNRFQPRQDYDEFELDELAASLKEKGFLQPILVRKAGEEFEVIAGERRLKAARKIGLARVPVVIKEATDQEALEMALIENIQRSNLNPIEEAQTYRRLVDEFGGTQEKVAKTVGKDRATVANALRLLNLPKEMQKALFERTITPGHARALLSVEDEHSRMVLFLEVVHKGLSVREAEALAKKGLEGKKHQEKKLRTRDPEIATLEEELRRIFGTKVLVENRRGNKGRLVVEYYSLNDLDRILGVVRK